ncbi:MAG: hypothetical protein ACTSVK_09780, partial [Promethearchaeota archaeon]
QRIFELTKEDFKRLNPNTRTCPIFRTRPDAELTRKIYERVPVLVNEETGENPWGMIIKRIFDMNKPENIFLCVQNESLKGQPYVEIFKKNYRPMYESKMFWQYNHRFGSYSNVTSRKNTHLPTPINEEHENPNYLIEPWYWIKINEIKKKLEFWNKNWLVAYRNITNATNERTIISTIIPYSGTDFSIRVIFTSKNSVLISCLVGLLNSIVLDYIGRQKLGGTNLSDYVTKQLPIIQPESFGVNISEFLVPRIIELMYTCWDIKPFADDVWNDSDERLRKAIRRQWEENQRKTGSHENARKPEWLDIIYSLSSKSKSTNKIPFTPFKWDEERRARLKAELDAYYAKLYGLTDEELRYILDPQDIFGPDFPGETFRVLKEKEIRKYGEYRTKRLILKAWYGEDNK